jgi:hypothetical protein
MTTNNGLEATGSGLDNGQRAMVATGAGLDNGQRAMIATGAGLDIFVFEIR